MLKAGNRVRSNGDLHKVGPEYTGVIESIDELCALIMRDDGRRSHITESGAWVVYTGPQKNPDVFVEVL